MLEYYSMATMVNEDMLSKAQYLSEALTRVPLIVKPAVSLREGKKVRTPISTVELASICLRAAGLELPDGVLPSDLNDYLGDDSAAGEKYIYTEAGLIKGIQNTEWKLVYYAGRPYGELYHLAEDPKERRNLWDDPSCQEKKQELLLMLLEKTVCLAQNASAKWSDPAPEI